MSVWIVEWRTPVNQWLPLTEILCSSKDSHAQYLMAKFQQEEPFAELRVVEYVRKEQ